MASLAGLFDERQSTDDVLLPRFTSTPTTPFVNPWPDSTAPSGHFDVGTLLPARRHPLPALPITKSKLVAKPQPKLFRDLFRDRDRLADGDYDDDGTIIYSQLKRYAEATLGSGNLRVAVVLPEGEDLNEWLAVNSQ